MVSFEKKTGNVAWKISRNYETPTENTDSYATPVVVTHAGRQQILVWGAEHVTAHDGTDGELLWHCNGFNPNQTPNWPSVASAVVSGDVLVIPYGRGSLLTGIRLGGSGDVSKSHRLWTREGTRGFVPTPAVYRGMVYFLGDRGEIECINPATGKSLWSDALPKHRGKYYASPLVADGKLYAAREDGVVFVTTINGDFKVLSENPMGEQMIASPVPLPGGRLLLRGENHLFCAGQ
jgi:outer membrane protein assembly factor BamB